MWRPVLPGISQGSILGQLLFLIYINDLSNELKSNVELFADDTSLFTIIKDKNESANTLNNGLSLISKWAFIWKVFFNPDLNKPVPELVFSRRRKSSISPDQKSKHYLVRKSFLTKAPQ